MDKMIDVLEQIEECTVGRYYENKKEKIINLIAKINGLDDGKRAKICELYKNEAINRLDTLQKVLNGLVMLECRKNVDEIRWLLLARKKAMLKVQTQKKWNNREEWLRYINSKAQSLDSDMERATFLYASGKIREALEIFKYYADAYHLFSVQACAELCREIGNIELEMKYVALLEKLYVELLQIDVPENIKQRTDELSECGYLEVKGKTACLDVEFFDENNYSKMTFKA